MQIKAKYPTGPIGSHTVKIKSHPGDYLYFIVSCFYSGARGGGYELLPAEGGGHGQGQPGQEEDHRVQSKDQIFS
jgi:hypothetical protein